MGKRVLGMSEAVDSPLGSSEEKLGKAVEDAIASCIEDGILEDYLRERGPAVKEMIVGQYATKQALKKCYEEGYDEARYNDVVNLSAAPLLFDEGVRGVLNISQDDMDRYSDRYQRELFRIDGRRHAELEDIRNLMRHGWAERGWDAERAMDYLKIPDEDRRVLLSWLDQDDEGR